MKSITKGKIASAALVASAFTFFQAAFAAVPALDTLIPHRGESHDAPENTLPAFKLAVDRGFGFECDIYLSKDGRIFTFHDKNLKRTTGGVNTKSCREATWDELKKLDVGNWGKWKDSRYKGTRPALLEEVLKLARDGRWIYVDVKSKTKDIVPYIRDVFAAQTKATPKNTLFLSGGECAKEFKRLMPEYKVFNCTLARYGWSKNAKPKTAAELIAETKAINADGVDVRYDRKVTTAEYIKAVKDAGLEFHVWTVDNIKDAKEAFARGVKTLTTNCAQKLLDEYKASVD